MNMLLFEHSDLEEGRLLRVGGERAEHLRSVLKVEPGSTIRVGLANGGKGNAVVREISGAEILLELLLPLAAAERRPMVDLLLALPRPQSLKKILQDTSALGVDSLTLFGSSRVEKSYFHSPLLKAENLSHYVRLGLEQGMATAVPAIAIVPRLSELFTGSSSPQRGRSLLLHPTASENLLELSARRPFGEGERVQLVIGPEGGFRDDEVRRFIENGSEAVTLGQRVLRVETAVCVGLGQLGLVLRS